MPSLVSDHKRIRTIYTYASVVPQSVREERGKEYVLWIRDRTHYVVQQYALTYTLSHYISSQFLLTSLVSYPHKEFAFTLSHIQYLYKRSEDNIKECVLRGIDDEMQNNTCMCIIELTIISITHAHQHTHYPNENVSICRVAFARPRPSNEYINANAYILQHVYQNQ